MSRENTLVITAYGHGDTIDKIAISTFEESSRYSYRDSENAVTYCNMTNKLELKEGNWIFAKIIPANTPISLKVLLPVKFHIVILGLDDRALQKVLREVNKNEITKAFMYCSNDVLDKVYRNMSGTAQKMLKEDMEYEGLVSENNVADSQEKILSIIRHLEDTGEIVTHKD